MNRRRDLILLLGAAALAPRLARAQAKPPAGKIWRIGIVSLAGTAIGRDLEVFRAGLRELGSVEGKNLVIEHRSSEGKHERPVEIAAELVRVKVDLILTTGTSATRAAQKATSTIPIVMAADADDPVASGHVSSLARPGGNITGLTTFGRGLSGKRLELLREALPKATRVAVLLNLDNARHQAVRKEIELAAAPLGLKLQLLEVRSLNDIESAVRAAVKDRADALMVPTDGFFTLNQQAIAKLAATNRLPTTYDRDDFVEAGGLMSYGVERDDMFRRSAYYVDRILKGAKPGDLPVEQPTKFELVVNVRTAKALGLSLPQPFLMRADKVIE